MNLFFLADGSAILHKGRAHANSSSCSFALRSNAHLKVDCSPSVTTLLVSLCAGTVCQHLLLVLTEKGEARHIAQSSFSQSQATFVDAVIAWTVFIFQWKETGEGNEEDRAIPPFLPSCDSVWV